MSSSTGMTMRVSDNRVYLPMPSVSEKGIQVWFPNNEINANMWYSLLCRRETDNIQVIKP